MNAIEAKLTLRLKDGEEVQLRVENDDRFCWSTSFHRHGIERTPDDVDHWTATFDGVMLEIRFTYAKQVDRYVRISLTEVIRFRPATADLSVLHSVRERSHTATSLSAFRTGIRSWY